MSVPVYFQVSHSGIDSSYMKNHDRLTFLLAELRKNLGEGRLNRIMIQSAASPDGETEINQLLSQYRSLALKSYLQERIDLHDSLFSISACGEDWKGTLQTIQSVESPWKMDVIQLIDEVDMQQDTSEEWTQSLEENLKQIAGGKAWRNLKEHIFPYLRKGVITLHSNKTNLRPIIECPNKDIIHITTDVDSLLPLQVEVSDKRKRFPWYLGVKTNLLYDLLLVPNVSLELYMGKRWSVSAGWIYGWWKNDKRHRFWRIYGGELELRKYFGKKSLEKPLTGHHVGIYGQVLTYDFELGGKGYMGGRPGGNIFDRANYGAGIAYGYSHAIGRRLNIDFTLGLGYLGGLCYVYKPGMIPQHYVWQSTQKKRIFAPTKAEISLVWLIGSPFDKKGGKR